MIKSVSALLLGASLLVAVPAHAAEYIVFSFTGTSTETITDPMLNPISVKTGAFSADLYVSATATTPYSYRATTTTGSITSPTSGGSQFSETNNAFGFSQTINANIDLAAPTTLPLGYNMVNGALTLFSQDASPSGNTQSRSIRAALYGLTVSRFSGTAVEGFQNVTALPEPATWMAMVLGFGFIGAMVRRGQAARSVTSPSR